MDIPYWEEALKEAEEYRSTCLGGLDRREVFTPRILYNILALSAEKYCMSLFYSRRIMPENHTFHDLSNTLQEVLGEGVKKEFLISFKELDKPQMNMCSLDIFKPEPMGFGDIKVYLIILNQLRDLIQSHLPQAAAV